MVLKMIWDKIEVTISIELVCVSLNLPTSYINERCTIVEQTIVTPFLVLQAYYIVFHPIM